MIENDCIFNFSCRSLLIIRKHFKGLSFSLIILPECEASFNLLIISPVKDVGYTHGLKFICQHDLNFGPSIKVEYVIPNGF